MEGAKLYYWIALVVLIQYTMIQSTEGCGPCTKKIYICGYRDRYLKSRDQSGGDDDFSNPWGPSVLSHPTSRDQRIQGKFR